MNNRLPERPTPRARHPERGSYRESLVVVGGARPLAHPGRGLGAVVVPTGPTYANSVGDALRRRVVTFDGFCPVKKPRGSKEAPLIGGHGPALSLVTEGTAYVNRVRDVLRRRVVTSDGFWPVKKLRVLEEASWVVVGRDRRSLGKL